jgi:hypothetical protein
MFASVRSKKEWSRWSIGRTSTMDAYLVQQLHMRPRQRKLSQNIMFYYLEWKFELKKNEITGGQRITTMIKKFA